MKVRMTMKEKRRLIATATGRLDKLIKGHASRGGLYAGGLASEGYNGGYRDALHDFVLILNGIRPNRQDFYDE